MASYTQIYLTVLGVPVAKGRPRFRKVGSYVQTYTPTETIKAEMEVARAFLGAYPEFSVCVGGAKTVLPDSTIAYYVDLWNRTRTDGNGTRNAKTTRRTLSTQSIRSKQKDCKGTDDSIGENCGRLPRGTSEGFGGVYKRNIESAGELKAKGAANGIAITCKFYCPIPSSLSKRKREQLRGQLCLKKPDIDNYVKLVCDALNGIAWEDDNVIANIVAVKIYDEQPRTEVHIYYLEEGLDKCENMCYTNNIPEAV